MNGGGRDKKVLPHNKKSVTADKPRQAPAARGGLGVVQGKKARSNENMDPGKIQDAPQAIFPESWTAKRPQAAKIDPQSHPMWKSMCHDTVGGNQ